MGQAGLGGATHYWVTARYHVGTQAQVEASDVGGRSQGQREALLECTPSADGPARGELLHRGTAAVEEPLALAERKIDCVGYSQALAGSILPAIFPH